MVARATAPAAHKAATRPDGSWSIKRYASCISKWKLVLVAVKVLFHFMAKHRYVYFVVVVEFLHSFTTVHSCSLMITPTSIPCPTTILQVLDALAQKGIAIRVASPKLVMEEAPESYKDVTAVVDTCHAAGISKKCVKLRPIAVIKG